MTAYMMAYNNQIFFLIVPLYRAGVSNRHVVGRMQPANIIYVAPNDFHKEQISQNN